MNVNINLPSADHVGETGYLVGDIVSDNSPPVDPDQDRLSEFLNTANGFYAFVYDRDDELLLATDIIESIPLYYARLDDTVVVSTEWKWVRNCVERELPSSQPDKVSQNEFLATGFVTGEHTVYESINRVPAGMVVAITPEEKDRSHYFNFEYRPTDDVTAEDLHKIMRRSCLRTLDYADGRPIWVSLSGGLDSRLLLTHFSALGYENLYAFTYGDPESDEVEIASQVAESLKVSWELIEYSNEKWRGWYRSEEREAYFDEVDENCIPRLLNWPAIGELRDQCLMAEDSVVVTGDAGDFIAGSHIPSSLYNRLTVHESNVIDEVLDRHYSYAEIPPDITAPIINRIKKIAATDSCINKRKCIEALERWDWRSRQARYIANKIQPCDYWGVDWYLPFWEASVVQFWMTVPLSERYQTSLYDRYVTQFYSSQADDATKIMETRATNNKSESLVNFIKKLIRESKLGPYIQPVYNKYVYNKYLKDTMTEADLRRDYHNDNMARYGMMSEETFVNEFNGSTNLPGYRTRQLADEIEFWPE